ncbi:MAG: hypothetical protein H6757_03955 [Candidatus Omnitrophica bacterium]|nr:hypothetical protein [Candidatus Omnitrophota bacterium]
MASKKALMPFLLLGFFFFFPQTPAQAKLSNIPKVYGRGLVNAVSIPLEALRTPYVEMKEHHWIWPFSFFPRTFRNVMFRTASVVNDLVFYPFTAGFVDEVPPMTEKIGISNYIWETEDEF